MIDNEFLENYKDQTPPWGFGGLGEIVYLRTYSRKVEGTDRNETWPETIQRVINGAIEIGTPYTKAEAEKLFDHMFHLRCSMSGRALWQMGTPLVQKFSAGSLNNCLSYETQVLTNEGVRSIGDMAGETAIIMDGKGSWVEAEIRSFGEQELRRITLRRNGVEKVLFATPDHRWFTYGQSHKEEWTTDTLPEGKNLVAIFGQGVGSVRPSAFGIAHGIVFGDGTKSGINGASGTRVVLCGEKNERLMKWFPNSPSRDVWQNGIRIGVEMADLPKSFKVAPSLQESKSYLYGWLAGYFAADGSVSKQGQMTMSSSCREHLELVRDVCYRLGVGTYSIRSQERVGIDGKMSTLYILTLIPETVTEDFFLIDNHADRWLEKYGEPSSRRALQQSKRSWKVVSVEKTDRVEEVFCAVVPTTHSFVLEDNILTGNCYFINIETIEDFEFLFEHLMLGGGVGFSVERSKIHEFPKVKTGVTITHERTNDADIIVPDSREGWKRLLHAVLKSYFQTGKSFSYSTILIREFGAPLNTFGGTASGPGALIEGIDDICKVMENRAGKKLRSVDVLDIANIIGRIVVSGSSRRSAQIAIGDPDDVLFLRAKNWGTGNVPGWRANSNNSIYADGYDEIMSELWKGYDGTGEPYGLLNRKLARTVGRLGEKKPDPSVEGYNPCVVGETLIGVADGRGAVPIAQLAEEGLDVPVYTFDPVNKKPVVRMMRNPHKTGTQVPVVKVILDSGDEVTCTPDHKFVTRDGEHVEAADLTPGTSLRIMTRYQSAFNPQDHTTHLKQPYWYITAGEQTNRGEHRMIAEYHAGRELDRSEVVHHVNHIGIDNTPGNLRVMSAVEHDALHAAEMLGENNPMARGMAGEFGQEWIDAYREKQRAISAESGNPNYSGYSHEELKAAALALTKKLGRRVSSGEWREWATANGYPIRFSGWRRNALGSIGGFLNWAAAEAGFIALHGQTARALGRLWAEGYDAEVRDGQIVFNKHCEVCDRAFTSTQRQTSICSTKCVNNRLASPAIRRKAMATQAVTNTNKHIAIREIQARVWSDLKYRLGRQPLKAEWVAACKAEGVSPEISRTSSPFRTYADLVDAGQNHNHKVVAVVDAGVADVYNGTVDEYHTYFMGGWESTTSSGKPKEQYVLNLNCGEIPLSSAESCNLATIFLPNVKSYKQFCEISRLLYKVQKTITGMSYPYEKTSKIVAKNRRLGQSVTGILQASEEQLSWLSKGYEALREYDVEYSAKHGIPESIRLTTVQPSGCRPADALTTTDQGILTLQELFVEHPDGDEWAELRGVNVVRPDGVFAAAKTYDNGKAEVLRLTMSFGLTVESTLNHPWFVSKRALDVKGGTRYQDVNEWIPAKDIQEGDVLEVVPGLYTKAESAALTRCDSRAVGMRGDAREIVQPERMNPDLAWLLGYLWGDGSQSPARWRIRFTDQNEVNIQKAARIIEEQFGLVPTIDQRDRSDYNLTVASVHLWHWLIKNGVWKYYADELDVIPEVVRRSSQEDVVAFLAGLIDADGWCGTTNGDVNWTVKLTSAYDEFTNHVQHVSWAVGLPMGRSWTAGSEGHLGDRGMYYMQLSAANASEEALGMLTRHSTKVVRMLEAFPDGRWPTGNRMQTGRVRSVEHVGYKETFDIEVPDGHHYFAGAVKSHNTLALLPGQTPGVHPAYARYYIRRVRFGAADPLVDACRKRGYNVVPDMGLDGREDHTKWVVEFPAESPEGAVLAKDMTAVEQLEWVKRMQTEWADNAVSVTVYYRLEELPAIKEWLKENYTSSVKSVSFLLHSDHNFPLAPYEEIDEETYNKMLSKVDFSVPLGSTIEGEDMIDDPSCATGACPVR